MAPPRRLSAEHAPSAESGGDRTLRVGGTPLLRFCDPPAAVRELLVATYGRLLRHGGHAPLAIEFRGRWRSGPMSTWIA